MRKCLDVKLVHSDAVAKAAQQPARKRDLAVSMLLRATRSLWLAPSLRQARIGSALRCCSNVPASGPAAAAEASGQAVAAEMATPATSATHATQAATAGGGGADVSAPLAEAMQQMKTVPIPIVVGPAGPELPPGGLSGVAAADSAAAADGVGQAIQALAMADNGGGWFFSRPMFWLESGLVYTHTATGA